ncbi:MAG TPA: hypothetical protein DEQ20_10510 [Desulfobulbaceae bacterium]|nr:hypothetical protein [Desulfobulbaceae bacterium]
MNSNKICELYSHAKPGFFFSSRILELLQVLFFLPIIAIILLTGCFPDPITNKVFAILSIVGAVYYFFGLVLLYFVEKKMRLISRILQFITK